MLRFIGAALLMSAAAGLGEQLCRRERAGFEMLEGYCALIKHMASQIKLFNLSFTEIFRRCDVKMLNSCGLTLPPSSAEQLAAAARAWLDSASQSALEAVVQQLHRGDRRALLDALDRCAAQLETAQDSARARCSARCRVIRVLCLCGGAMVALVLL